MHREPISSQQSLETTNVLISETASQHGIHEADASTTQRSTSTADDGLATQEQVASDSQTAADLEQRSSRAITPEAPGRLSIATTPSPPPTAGRDRITEYEQASTPPVRKRAGPGFEVIQKTRSPSDKRSPIQELPNEVLTHALAHLSPVDLTSVSLVSKRFHDLVTGPHAWRTAFSHFFPGSDSLAAQVGEAESGSQDGIRSGRRAFTRLTAFASWRSEYIVRTRLLRSLARGRPVQALATPSSARSGHAHVAVPTVMYNSQLFTTINRLHATFGTALNKRLPRCIHAGDDQGLATSSDPVTGKVDAWGITDPQSFLQFAERFPGDAQYGLGPGEVVGVPNVVDVSQPYGVLHGEGSPGGMAYFRSTEELRGRFLALSSAMCDPEFGIPRIIPTHESVTSVWIAKSLAIPSLTEGSVGLLIGSSSGILTAYSLGLTNSGSPRDQRFNRGQMTARWAVSPGVPLISIATDNDYTLKRYAQNRIWAVVLNALGEVFYLTKFPKRPPIERNARLTDEEYERMAWITGRSVYWNIVEASRRKARPDPYAAASTDGSYSPRSSWNGMCLSKSQIESETHEIEDFASRKPKTFQKLCLGWDMRRKCEVDFAGDDGNNAGENVVVFDCGLGEGDIAGIVRYSRCRFREMRGDETATTPQLTSASTDGSVSPATSAPPLSPLMADAPGFSFDSLEESLSKEDPTGSSTPRPMSEEWRSSTFDFGGLRHVQILASAIDNSTFASQTASEDPLLGLSGRSTASSPTLTPLPMDERAADPQSIPGHRARLFAVGTHLGSVLLWNIRAPVPRSLEISNTIEPVRIIYTSSPQISCLALSSLYLVHGGNDGLVQAWDPLGSDMQPVRTLHSRFRSRARRRLVQAQASPQGVGINLFAAGAICLDPDPTILRGVVSLGTQILYWSFSSSAADQYKSSKRRLRHTDRGSNHGGERISATARGNLKDYIATERHEMDREKAQHRKELQRFASRFGTDLMDGSEEEMLAYASMLSQESLAEDSVRRASDASTAISSVDYSAVTTNIPTPVGSLSPPRSMTKTDEEFDADIAEAIRQSMASSPPAAAFDIPIRRARPKGHKGSSARPSPRVSPTLAGSSQTAAEMTDLDFALQLSLAEEQSRHDASAVVEEDPEFPALASASGRLSGKGKGRAI